MRRVSQSSGNVQWPRVDPVPILQPPEPQESQHTDAEDDVWHP